MGTQAVIDARAATAARIISNQSAGSTQKLYFAHFKRWNTFARARGIPSVPEDNQSYQALRRQIACLDAFAIDMYRYNATRWQATGRTGRAAGNKPGTFNQIFFGINHVITKIYGKSPLRSSFVDQAKASYKRDFSQPTKKARPLRGSELRRLVEFADAHSHDLPWLNVVAKVVVIMWSTAGRWSCIYRIDIGKSIEHPAANGHPANPQPGFSSIFWYGRKNRQELTFTTCPTVANSRLDARSCLLWLINTFNRIVPTSGNGHGIIPQLSPDGLGGFKINPDPTRRCNYNNFLRAFRSAMKLAGLQRECNAIHSSTSNEWSLHAGRRGFVTEARSLDNGTPLLYEVLSLHGAWSIESMDCMLGYNECSPADHAKTISRLMHSALALSPTPGTTSFVDPLSPSRKRKR